MLLVSFGDMDTKPTVELAPQDLQRLLHDDDPVAAGEIVVDIPDPSPGDAVPRFAYTTQRTDVSTIAMRRFRAPVASTINPLDHPAGRRDEIDTVVAQPLTRTPPRPSNPVSLHRHAVITMPPLAEARPRARAATGTGTQPPQAYPAELDDDLAIPMEPGRSAEPRSSDSDSAVVARFVEIPSASRREPADAVHHEPSIIITADAVRPAPPPPIAQLPRPLFDTPSGTMPPLERAPAVLHASAELVIATALRDLVALDAGTPRDHARPDPTWTPPRTVQPRHIVAALAVVLAIVAALYLLASNIL